MMYPTPRVHGGPDASGAAQFDFSTNSNACGPCPAALMSVQQADATRYPDASYTALREQLAVLHGVDVQRVVLAASASEFIFRITSMVARRGGRTVGLPPHSYGDYAHAAIANGLAVANDAVDADLYWACEPSSPLGAAHENWHIIKNAVRVLDRAYEPLRLSGKFSHSGCLNAFWQLYSPNKALGLTGVRAAYAIAPVDGQKDIDAMHQLCPSWPLGAHGEAMLQAWADPAVQSWLAGSLVTLREWKARQLKLCESLGWTNLPSDANFFCAVPALPSSWSLPTALVLLREQGIKLRDAGSFGLPSHVRLGVLAPTAQDALDNAWRQIVKGHQ
jgi:histidinol-phosphate aminotransferase